MGQDVTVDMMEGTQASLKKQKPNVAEGVKVESTDSIQGPKYKTWQRCVSIYLKK